jgi:hypothetical protein
MTKKKFYNLDTRMATWSVRRTSCGSHSPGTNLIKHFLLSLTLRKNKLECLTKKTSFDLDKYAKMLVRECHKAPYKKLECLPLEKSIFVNLDLAILREPF